MNRGLPPKVMMPALKQVSVPCTCDNGYAYRKMLGLKKNALRTADMHIFDSDGKIRKHNFASEIEFDLLTDGLELYQNRKTTFVRNRPTQSFVPRSVGSRCRTKMNGEVILESVSFKCSRSCWKSVRLHHISEALRP